MSLIVILLSAGNTPLKKLLKMFSLYQENGEFTFSPEGGTLRPLEAVEVQIKWSPQHCISLHTVFEVNVEGGSERWDGLWPILNQMR